MIDLGRETYGNKSTKFVFQSLVMILPRFFSIWKTIIKSLGKN